MAPPTMTPPSMTPPAARHRARRLGRTAAGVGAPPWRSVLAGWIGVAVADTGSPTTTTPSQSAPAANGPTTAPAGAPGPGGPGFGFGGGRGHGGPGGAGGSIHGQFTVPDGSGYRNVDTQTGQVTDVSQGSITVKSSDGFSKTYSVTENTLVNAGRDGIGSVKSGDTVQLSASDNGTTAEAMNIDDVTTSSAIHDHWRPQAPPQSNPGGGTSGSPTTTTG